MILWTIAGASPAAFSLLGLLFVSISLGLSNFAAAIGIGLSGVDAQTRLKTGLIFGFFEALMPILGLLLGQGLAGLFGDIGHYGGAGLLILTGVYTLWQTRKHATKPRASVEK
jgi:putative Mn2+ efflux pump MntP